MDGEYNTKKIDALLRCSIKRCFDGRHLWQAKQSMDLEKMHCPIIQKQEAISKISF